MYTKYKKELTDKSSLKPAGHGQAICSCGVRKTVSDCWVEIDRQMKEYDAHHTAPVTHSLPTPGGWRNVRLFVSSTFTDFFNEREILVKKVFPELREWCSERRVKLTEVDLRWGIPSVATSGETIATCLGELDSCHETSEGEPFFLNMLGERYGWVPDKSVIPEEVQEKYSWVNDTSITFMEILHGALRSRNPNAAFFLRDPSFLSDLPEQYHRAFQDKDPLYKEHLRVLKSKLEAVFAANTFHYTATYSGVSTATGRHLVQLTGLDDFATKCLTFFKQSIERKYPDQLDIASYNETDQEKELQTMFITEKADLVIGRDDDLQVLMDYITGNDSERLDKIAGAETTIRGKTQDWELSDDDNFICIVEGRSGWGKTSLLCRFVVEATAKFPDLFFHFCGSTARSYSEHELLKSLIHFLSPQLTDDEVKMMNGSIEEQTSLLNTALVRFRQGERNAVIVVDAVNELNTKYTISHLSWLPATIPHNLRVVVSCNEHAVTLARLKEHPAYWFKMEPLSAETLKNIAVMYLGNFKKRLDEEQLSMLMTRSKVDGPLWMTLMCEELRVFGDFQTINKKINEMPDSLNRLFGVIFVRLQNEDNTGCIKKALCCMASSENGILSSDILKVLGDPEKKEFAPALYWAQAKRHLKPYIRVTGFPEEYVTFYHEAIWKAVRENFLSTREDEKTWQLHLANYYQFWCDRPRLKVTYLPLHLKRAEEHNRLIDFLKNDADSMMIPPYDRSRYFQDHRCIRLADKVISSTQEAKICNFCRKTMRVFNPGNMILAEHSCVICAAHCFSFNNQQTGRICSVHAMKFRNSCFVCNHYIFPNDTKAIAGKLCHGCSFGINGKKCVVIGLN